MTITKSSTQPLVVVVGATGSQGGSVITNLDRSNVAYRIRGLTRDVSKPAAQALQEKGVELAQVNLTTENAAGIKDAFQGANYVFIMTNYWEHADIKREYDEATLMFDIAHESGAQILWAGLPSITKISNGVLTHAEQFDGKANISQYAKSKGYAFIDFQPAWYMNTVTSVLTPKRNAEGDGYTLLFPIAKDRKIAYIWTEEDFGLFVRAAIETGAFKAGDTVPVFSEELTGEEVAQQYSQASGKSVTWVEQSKEDFLANFPFGDFNIRVYDAFKSWSDYGYYGSQDTKEVLARLPTKTHTFVDHLKSVDLATVLQ